MTAPNPLSPGNTSRRGAVAVTSLVAGVLVALSVPPWGFWILGPAGMAVLTWRLALLSAGRGRFVAGLAFGIGQLGLTLFWMTEFHAIGFGAVVVAEAGFFAVACLALPGGRGPHRLVALPAVMVLAEAARGVVPFGGLPMGGVALGQAAGPLAPVARLGGPLLLVGVVAAFGVAVALIGRRRLRPAAVLVASLALVVVLGGVAPAGSVRSTIDVAVVQGGGPRGYRAVESDADAVYERHVAIGQQLEPPLDLVLWPENAIDVDTIEGSPEAADLGALAARLRATVVAGVTQETGLDRFRNDAVAWGPDGTIVDLYTKAHRVPFGEYVPARSLFEKLGDLSGLPRDAVAGQGPGVLDTPAGRLGVAISFEVFFSERALAAVRSGGEVLLVPTNASSYTTSQVPTQEMAAAQLQAWSTGRWVVASAPTGYGAIVDHRGRVRQRTTLGRAETLVGRVDLRRGSTPYARLGDPPIVALALVVLAGAWLSRRSTRHTMRPMASSPISSPAEKRSEAK